jgi:hypothetical protein
MGQVFLGRSPGGRLVAVKVVRAELATDPEFRTRFGREVAAARKVSGLFTAVVVDADPEARLPWLVTNFVNGPSLAQAVAEHGELPVASVLALAAGLAEGLGAVHAAGVVHRDLKPSNVLLAEDGPRLIDFGISQAADVTALTSAGMVVGSPGFMSPEQAEGNAVRSASDIFSLGAVLVFAATGEGPFGAGTPGAQLYRVVHSAPRLDRLSGQVRLLVERCLAKDQAERPTATQFLAELTAAHPSAADLSDWLPSGILPVTSPLAVLTSRASERAASGAQAADPEISPMPATPPVAAEPVAAGPGVPAPPAAWPPAAWPPTATAAAQYSQGQDSQSRAVQAEWQAVDRAGLVAPAAFMPSGIPRAPLAPGSRKPNWLSAVTGILVRPVTVAGPAAGRRRRRWAVSGIAVMVILAAVIGLIVAAPWKNSPVLRPTGLVTDTSTISAVAFRWSGPATGPAPDRYEIIRDGRPVGYVPGNITFYRDTGLAPASSYKFQVIAIRGGRLSPRSAILATDTITPPVSDAVLNGTWPTQSTVTSTSHFTWSDAKTQSSDWSFTPACVAGPCNITLNGYFDKVAFTAPLSRAGAVYTGTAPLRKWSYCSLSRSYTSTTLRIRIQVQDAVVSGKKWTASSWNGTVTAAISAVTKCRSGTVDAKVSSL